MKEASTKETLSGHDGNTYISPRRLKSAIANIDIPEGKDGWQPIEIIEGQDLNSMDNLGTYNCIYNSTARTLLNSPTDRAFGMLVYRTTLGSFVQELTEYWGEYAPVKYIRTYYLSTNSWTEWTRINEKEILLYEGILSGTKWITIENLSQYRKLVFYSQLFSSQVVSVMDLTIDNDVFATRNINPSAVGSAEDGVPNGIYTVNIRVNVTTGKVECSRAGYLKENVWQDRPNSIHYAVKRITGIK